jgi:hypothetical protein
LDFIRGLFSSQPGLDRVNPLGIVLMVVGAVIALLVSGRLEKRDGSITGRVIACKLGGLVIACVGALIAIS